jgi:hypothetical protein
LATVQSSPLGCVATETVKAVLLARPDLSVAPVVSPEIETPDPFTSKDSPLDVRPAILAEMLYVAAAEPLAEPAPPHAVSPNEAVQIKPTAAIRQKNLPHITIISP